LDRVTQNGPMDDSGIFYGFNGLGKGEIYYRVA